MRIVAPLALAAMGAAHLAGGLTGEEVLRSAVDADKRQEISRQQYLYRDHMEHRQAAVDGSPGKVTRSRDFEIISLEGESYHKLIAMDGKPLNVKQAAEEEERIRMTAAERKTKPKGKMVRSGVPLTAILEVMDHQILREEAVGGRQCWVVQSTPKPGAAPRTAWEAEALRYRYTIWIDQGEKTPLRRDWEVIAKGASTKPGSTVKVTFAKLPDGAWLPERAEFMSITKGGAAGRVFQTDTYSNYSRFRSDTSIEFEDPRQ